MIDRMNDRRKLQTPISQHAKAGVKKAIRLKKLRLVKLGTLLCCKCNILH